MRSIYAKILLWSLATFVASLVAFAVVSYRFANQSPGPGAFLASTLAMIEDDLVEAYEQGGPDRLARTLRRLDSYYHAEHFLTDARGRDLVDGRDRSNWLGRVGMPPRFVPGMPGKHIIQRVPRDVRYRFLVLIEPRFDPMGILPYFVAVVMVIAILGYALAVHLASPLRTLRDVVDRFGRGDLAARANSSRKDEIGAVSRAFDEMAGQIETLRAAERRLLQDVSHELRSPLARLGFNLELARINDDPAVAFGRIARDFERLSTLVAELLELTCVEGDPSSRSNEEVRLDDLVLALAEDCEVEASAKGCRLGLKVDSPSLFVGDPELLRRAVENVLRNAIRHAPAGTVIELDLRTGANGPAITVRDFGPGVPNTALESIFEPFFRVDNDRSRASGGAGLGLAIARRSIERHRGRVSAEAALPGLRVTIELPASLNGTRDGRPGTRSPRTPR